MPSGSELTRSEGSRFLTRYGPWAVIAGASEGIGASFARQLAARGFKLVLIARRQSVLDALAKELKVEVKTVSLDLTATELQARIAEATHGLEVGLLICNAALSLTSEFIALSGADVQRTLDLNVRAPTVLAHHFLPAMIQRRRGGVVFMSSLAALTGAPRVATYAGSKAFAFGFAESLFAEVKEHGVDVLVCGAGPTHTPTYDAVMHDSFPPVMNADDVVRETLAALGKQPRVIPGAFNRWVARLMAVMPRAWALRMVARQTDRLASRRRDG